VAGEASEDKLKDGLETAENDQRAAKGSAERLIGANGFAMPERDDYLKPDASMVRPADKRCEVW